MVTLPSKQRGGIRVDEVISGLSDMRKSFVRAVKAPALHFNALNKEQKSRMIHEVMALGGAMLCIVGPFAMASQGVSFDEFVDAIKDTPEALEALAKAPVTMIYDYEGTINTIFEDDMAEKLLLIGGSSASGAYIFIRNMIQRFMFSNRSKSTEKTRQWTRVKEMFSNAVSAVTNLPQTMEGIATESPERSAAGGTAMAAYGIRGFIRFPIEFGGRLFKKGFEFKENVFTHKVPGALMTLRGFGFQGMCAFTAGSTISVSTGIIWGGVTIIQGTGGLMMYNRDKPGKKPDAPQIQRLP